MKKGSVFIVIAAILWGVDGILRRSLYVLPPITIVFLEHVVGLLILSPFFIRSLKGEKLLKKEWWGLIWISILSGVLGTLWFTTALLSINFIPFSVVFLLQKLQPIFAIASARFLLKEKLDWNYAKWALLALIAAYFVTFPDGFVNLKTGQGTIIAALFAVGAAFAWGSSTAFSRYTLLKHSQTYITGMRFLLTAIFAFVFVVAMGQMSSLKNVTPVQISTFALIALSTGMVALLIYYKGLKQTPVKVATFLELAFPLTAVVIDFLVYKTVLAPSQYLASVVLLFAIYHIGKLNKT